MSGPGVSTIVAVFLIGVVFGVGLFSTKALRILAAWMIARAYFLENARAENALWRARADKLRHKLAVEYGVAPKEPTTTPAAGEA